MKPIYKLELIIATIIICLLVGISIPRFLKVQYRGAEQRIQSGLDTLFTAVKAYTNDYNSILPERFQSGDSYTLPHAKSHQKFFQFLPDSGYLTENEYLSALEKIEITPDERRTFVFVQTIQTNGEIQLHNLGISVINPNMDHEWMGYDTALQAIFAYGDFTTGKDPRHWQTFVSPTGYYHITNGIQSIGVIYQDFLGNRSTE